MPASKFLNNKFLPGVRVNWLNTYALTPVPSSLLASSLVNRTLANLDWLYASVAVYFVLCWGWV